MKRFVIFIFLAQLNYLLNAVVLPSVISDHMVLQQNQTVKIWGWGSPLENIVVTPSWDNSESKTIVNNHAYWELQLKTPSASGPYTITIKGHNTIVVNDILIGEVWLCSGQSNMEWRTSAGINNGADEKKLATNSQIRFFTVDKRASLHQQIDVIGKWVVCTPETMYDFSAIGYFFGKKLNEKLKIPVGMINSSWGGTPAEIWYDADDLAKDDFLVEGAKKLADVPWGPNEPGITYNAMIAPLTSYKIAGALWYQGEGNTGLDKYYTQTLSALIKSWRRVWNSEFPFYYVQIAPYKYGTPLVGVKIQNAQRLVNEPNSGMVVINDIGDTTDIHPKNKIEVAYRLANMALGKHYGIAGIPFSGPLYKDMKIEKNRIRIFFDHAENGLKTNDKSLSYFEIAGNDNVFYPALAVIEKNTIVVASKNVKEPLFVRFAWSNTAVPSLFNAEGLPASCFTTEK